MERWAREKESGKERQEVVYGITSLPPRLAGPERLLGLTRGQWLVENRSHWVRDVTLEHSWCEASSQPSLPSAI